MRHKSTSTPGKWRPWAEFVNLSSKTLNSLKFDKKSRYLDFD